MALIKGSVRPISINSTKVILHQIEKCICGVSLNIDRSQKGTAFFCTIPIDNEKVPVMISCDFNLYNFEQSDYINLLFNGEIKKLNLNEDREIYLNKELSIIIIEILPDIDNINNFLEVDLDFKFEEDFIYENAYILQFLNGEGFISYGNIDKMMETHKIKHFCSTEEGSSGSPILNLTNHKVVGIHCGSNSNRRVNYGTLLRYPIIEFINKFKNKYNDKNFTNLKLLSAGSYSDIYSAFSTKDKIEVCLKKINLDKMKLNYQKNELNNYKKDLAREINKSLISNIWELIENCHYFLFLGYKNNKDSLIYIEVNGSSYITKLLSKNENSLKYLGSYNNKIEKILVLEKCDLNYYELIKQREQAISIEEIRNKFSKMNKLFKEIQDRKIIHRDIKLENILIKYTNKEKTDYIIKLCDYGFGKIKDDDSLFSGLKGTFETIAPEILLKKTNHYEDKVDIFSLGVILFQLANNLRHPFGLYYPEIVVNYQKNFEKDNFVIKFDDSIKDKPFIDLVSKMLKINPHNRLNWNSYFEHPFFQKK